MHFHSRATLLYLFPFNVVKGFDSIKFAVTYLYWYVLYSRAHYVLFLLYSATLFYVFVNIVYFYSSVSRFLLVMGGTVLMYL